MLQSVYLCEGLVATVQDVIEELFTALDAYDEVPNHADTTQPAAHQQVLR